MEVGDNRIIIVGDLFPVPSNFSKFSEGDISYLFGKEICDLFAKADYRICNLEGALTDNPGKCEKTGAALFAPTNVITAYKELGIDCCALANNHITDAGDRGVLDTMNTLDQVGIQHLGAGIDINSIIHFLTFEIGGRKIGLYNVAETMYNAPTDTKPGAFLYDEYIVCKELVSFKQQCDYLIVVYHGGAEKFRYPSPQTKRRFHRMVDSGADMILSQHTHCVGSEEYYKGAYLLYGQGNFLFRCFNDNFTNAGIIIELVLSDNGVRVNKHLVKAGTDIVRYDEHQDFVSFDERSSHIEDEAFVQKQFDQYCLKELTVYLKAYKGKIPLRAILNRFFPKIYKSILFHGYERKQLLLTLHSLRSEQNREIAINGLLEYLRKTEK
jgi:poly-gamma-glutamate synthesis protein (capsule biosynthesis protein)